MTQVLAPAPVPEAVLLSPPTLPSNQNQSSLNQNNHVNLDLRNYRITIDRESLMELPESVLLCLFPNGFVFNQRQQQTNSYPQNQSRFIQDHGVTLDDVEDDDDVYYVDFDGACLSFILKFFNESRISYYGTDPPPQDSPAPPQQLPSPLFYKQAIIVLREELEYFAVPSHKPDDGSDPHTYQLKKLCGDQILERRSIFTPLQRNINRENNVAEQHLIDMLCMSGFNREDEWGYRSIEPRRCCITSLALVLLKTGITHDHPPGHPSTGPQSPTQMNPRVSNQQLTTAQKLLLFWRKPARKCWWDATEVSLPIPKQEKPLDVKLWARRVWTLELSLI
ncbi:uncharacterized protein MELLADRAFT_77632 [Melampsora larici-populina 98AG31]|uniref:Phosphatase activator n=1 Tax=Melampsora larici-populina (strain 98AG31 / pathotype 3-4-7) TaxID=747676 RepID=F4RJX4_MELLP|nr:uncharacterized protein MELLADRAFT_77632 [Melampsora larici-populina 98AG31]EGG07387.1 hypothetical protein MELLADRAFT_77632 [Melampsora larici-populina 98AG31]